MQNIQEVSLGFAEFVSQLIQETFDAILSSQNYQLERYAELQGRLDLSTDAYRQAYGIDEKVEDRMVQYFGFIVTRQTAVNQALNDFLVDNFDDPASFTTTNGRLSQQGLDDIKDLMAESIISEEKTILNTLVNQSEASRLVVDSGEITAKLELSSMFMDNQTDDDNTGGVQTPNKEQESGNTKLLEGVPKIVNPNPKIPNTNTGEDKDPDGIKETTSNPTKDPGAVNQLLLPSYNRNIKVFQFQNTDSGKNTLLIDRNQFDAVNNSSVLIPNVRLSAQPTKLTSNSNLYSEVKISFKTV